MEEKEVFYTNETGVRNWENGEVFWAFPEESFQNQIRFTVSSGHIAERGPWYVIIDTGNDADL